MAEANRAINHKITFKNDVVLEMTPETTVNVGTTESDVEAVEYGNGISQQTVLTLDAKEITVANTTGVSFGGAKIYTFPQGRIFVKGVTLKLLTVGLGNAGNATPIAGTMGGDISLGTTPPSDGTLTVADVALLPSTSIDPISGGITGAALAAAAQFDGTTTPIPVYINMLIDDADVADGASDILELSATITITWDYLGDY